jgi:hypothetical protein
MQVLFRQLTPKQEQLFRQWAREHLEKVNDIDPCWHPVVRDEFEKMKQVNNGTHQI